MEKNGRYFPDLKTNQNNANTGNWNNHKWIVAGILGKVCKTLLILSSLLVLGCNLPTKAKGYLQWCSTVSLRMFVDILHYFHLFSEWLWASLGIDWFLILLVSSIGSIGRRGCAVVVKDQVFGCDWCHNMLSGVFQFSCSFSLAPLQVMGKGRKYIGASTCIDEWLTFVIEFVSCMWSIQDPSASVFVPLLSWLRCTTGNSTTFLCFTILAAFVYHFRLCHLSEHLIPEGVTGLETSSFHHFPVLNSYALFMYCSRMVIFSWEQDQVLGETFHFSIVFSAWLRFWGLC